MGIMLVEVYATGQYKDKDGKTLVCDKHDRAITWVFCGDLQTLMFSDLL